MSALRTVALGAAGQLSLGSLFVRLTLDSAQFVKGWTHAQTTVTSGAALMTKAVVGMTAATGLALTAVAGIGVREAARFEQSFAQVKRTVEGTQAQFAEMSAQFRQMAKEIPVNVNAINETASAAGALGIATEDIVEFTRVMIDMGATTNMTSTQAATAMGRIANIMGNTGDEFGRMGSTILKLGVSTAATESEITSMGTRLAGSGRIMKMTTAEVLGLAASLSSVGVRAEVGGTMMVQVMDIMARAAHEGGADLMGLAQIAGVSMSSFRDSIQNDAIGAIVQFFEGLKAIDREGGNVFAALDSIGIEGRRVAVHLLQAAGASEKLAGWVKIGTDAWEENTARAKATAEIYSTFISQLKMLGGQIRDFFISVGEQLIPTLKVLVTMLRESMQSTDGLGGSLQSFVDNVGPAFIYTIKQIGDIIYGWQLVIKTGEVAFLGMAALVLGVFTKVTQGIADRMAGLVNVIGAGVDKAIDAINILLPKAQELGKLNLNIKATLPESLVTATQATTEAFQESMNELEAIAAKGQFSDRFEAEYKKVTAVVKEENEKVVEDVEKTVEKVVQRLPAMSDRMRKAFMDLTDASKKQAEGSTLGADLDMGHGRRSGSILNQFQSPEMETMSRIAEERRLAEENLALLMEMDNLELEMTEAMQQKKLEMMEAYNEKIKALQLAQAEIIFSTSSKMFEDLSTIASAFAGEQSGIYKAMFAASKAFAVAESIIKIQQGIAAAAAMPWPANLAAIASVVSATANIVSTIQSVKLEFAGKREMGGPVSSGKAFLVGEAGPEMFVPNSAGNIVPNDELGGGRVKVVVNNYSDASAEVTERNEGNERVIEIMIRRTKSEISSEIRDGRGDVSRAMESTFGLKRGKT